MPFYSSVVRRFLARRGYSVSRLDASASEPLAGFLDRTAQRTSRAYLLDGDPETLNAVTRAFGAERVTSPDSAAPAWVLPNSPDTAPACVAIDLDQLLAPAAQAANELFERAGVVLVRTKLARFTADDQALRRACERLLPFRLELHDVIYRNLTPPLQALGENVFLGFLPPGGEAARTPTARTRRLVEAIVHLGGPILGEGDFRQLAGRGTAGFAAGVCNPGAITWAGRRLLLARGDALPWPVLKHRPDEFARSCTPLLLELGDDDTIARLQPARLDRTDAQPSTRFEDFRLFAHGGSLYSNHSCLETPAGQGGQIRPETILSRVGLSRVDPEGARLEWLGTPNLGRPLARTEKNWAMFSLGNAVGLIYSFQPFRLFTTPDLVRLQFTAAGEHPVELPWPDDGLPFRNSINPIPYDPDRLLHIVHKVYPTKRYVYWAVLIDRTRLRPTHITRRPLLFAPLSVCASIAYACAATLEHDRLTIFAGIDDCGIGRWSMPRERLDSEWIELACRN